MGEMGDAPEHQRMDRVHHHQAGYAPGQRKTQANITVQVKGLVGVVPPVLVKELFQRKAGEPFDGGGDRHRAEEKQKLVLPQREQAGQHRRRAKAVHRAPGTVEKAAVDELAGDECVVGHLQAPAQKGVDEEKKECFVHSGRLLSGLSVL